MIPVPKQRWLYQDTSSANDDWLVEILTVSLTKVTVKVLWAKKGQDATYPTGQTYDSSGLQDVFNGYDGYSSRSWTYLEGQEAP